MFHRFLSLCLGRYVARRVAIRPRELHPIKLVGTQQNAGEQDSVGRDNEGIDRNDPTPLAAVGPIVVHGPTDRRIVQCCRECFS